MPRYESIQEVLENTYKYMAEALGATEKEVMQACHEEMYQTKKTKRLRQLIDEATLKAIMFRNIMLEDMAKWDENPKEPTQFKYTIYATIEPKNHS